MVSKAAPNGSIRGLTARQREIAHFVAESVAAGRPPSRADIARRFNVNRATAQQHVAALERQGVLKREPGARGLRLIGGLVAAERQVPVLGRVPAGTPLLAVEDSEELLAIPDGLFRYPVDVLLRVVGDSMQGAGIYDGDLVAIVFRSSAEHGEIVVARINDEITVKRLRKTSDFIELIAENPAYPPIRISEELDFSIEAAVIGVIRRL